MSPLDAALAVGGPNLVSGEGWDVAPLLFVVALLLLMRWARIPLLTTIASLVLIFGIVALRRTPGH